MAKRRGGSRQPESFPRSKRPTVPRAYAYDRAGPWVSRAQGSRAGGLTSAIEPRPPRAHWRVERKPKLHGTRAERRGG
jgi:hypothetical protein